MASVAIAAAIALAGCDTDGTSQIPGRAMAPLSQDMRAELVRRQMPDESPILVRIFKEEAELEVWKQDNTGRFALLKTYPICRWSGDLGPKIKEGDRQAPEGFYQITPGLMNPNSNYYLAFNLGFPNAYDRANDRTGAFLMVHGDCSSRGCYAMTDEQIGEIFALGRDSFQGGQKSFQVQAYPFRMTPLNMAKHRNSPHMAFWRMIKQGYDHFEVTRQEPRIDVCEKHYVFNAESRTGAPLNFNSRGRCPAYQLGPEVAQAIASKHAQDEQQYAEYVARNTPTAPIRTGADGGMHPTFLAKLKPKKLLDGVFASNHVVGAQPGAMGNNVNPPADAVITRDNVTASVASGEAMQTAAYSPAPAAKPAAASTAAAPAQPSALARMGQFFGLRTADAAPPPPQPKPAVAAAPAKPVAGTKPKTPPVPAPKPAQVAQAPATQAAEPAPASAPGLINGAVAPLPTSTFDSRWGATR
jgi:murein L,D-transpeptidase YafK